MTPEEQARAIIDAKLLASGWIVQPYRAMNLGAGRGLAVTEFPGAHGEADYLLYVEAKAIGIVEAKPVGHTLKGVEGQSAAYAEGLPAKLPAWRRPLPFQYESTGLVTQFTNWMEPHARSRGIFQFFRPESLLEMVLQADPLRARLQGMPPLPSEGLWPKQWEAITNLERSLAFGKPKALICPRVFFGEFWGNCCVHWTVRIESAAMTMNALDIYCNVEQAAALIGCTGGRVRQLLASGELCGVKVNHRAWLVEIAGAKDWASRPKQAGRTRVMDRRKKTG